MRLNCKYLYTLDDGQRVNKYLLQYTESDRRILPPRLMVKSTNYPVFSWEDNGMFGKFVNNVIQFVDNLYYNTDKVNYTSV